MPEYWVRNIVNPIPQNPTTDPSDTFTYRDISLASSPYWLYTEIVNRRLTTWAELNGKVGDEQNGVELDTTVLIIANNHIFSPSKKRL